MEDSSKEPRFKGRLYIGNKLVRTITLKVPPRIGEEILYHDSHELPLERWLVKRIAWQVTKDTGLTWFHAAVEKIENEAWPPLKYP